MKSFLDKKLIKAQAFQIYDARYTKKALVITQGFLIKIHTQKLVLHIHEDGIIILYYFIVVCEIIIYKIVMSFHIKHLSLLKWFTHS